MHLQAIESAVTFSPSGLKEQVLSITERALEHLQRSLLVDDLLRQRWLNAFDKHEEQIEAAWCRSSSRPWDIDEECKDVVYRNVDISLSPAHPSTAARARKMMQSAGKFPALMGQVCRCILTIGTFTAALCLQPVVGIKKRRAAE